MKKFLTKLFTSNIKKHYLKDKQFYYEYIKKDDVQRRVNENFDINNQNDTAYVLFEEAGILNIKRDIEFTTFSKQE